MKNTRLHIDDGIFRFHNKMKQIGFNFASQVIQMIRSYKMLKTSVKSSNKHTHTNPKTKTKYISKLNMTCHRIFGHWPINN